MQDMETAKLYNFEVALFALSTKEPVGVVTISSDIQPPPPFVPPTTYKRAIVQQNISLPESNQLARDAVFTSADTIIRVLEEHKYHYEP